jgi:hypothetical protein
MHSIGDRVKVAAENDNEGYNNFRGKVLIVTHVATSKEQHPGYDPAMAGEGLYDFKTEDGEPVGSSLYDYELEDAERAANPPMYCAVYVHGGGVIGHVSISADLESLKTQMMQDYIDDDFDPKTGSAQIWDDKRNIMFCYETHVFNKQRFIIKAWTTLDGDGVYTDVYTNYEDALRNHHGNHLHQGFTTTTDWDDGESFYFSMEEIVADLEQYGFVPVDKTKEE